MAKKKNKLQLEVEKYILEENDRMFHYTDLQASLSLVMERKMKAGDPVAGLIKIMKGLFHDLHTQCEQLMQENSDLLNNVNQANGYIQELNASVEALKHGLYAQTINETQGNNDKPKV